MTAAFGPPFYREHNVRNFTTLLLVICLFVGCALAGYAWGFLAGSAQAREEITADCVKHGHFEFRTHVYVCDLNAESKERVFSRPTET